MYSIGSKHIKVFLEAARTLSFTEAAQRLYTTQPSVSRIIRQMEEEIGVALFYRSRFSKDTQGIGLGLPLAKAIIEDHNGTIEVNSTLGAGTTFTINFLNPTKL